MMIEVYYDLLSADELYFVENLARASVCDIIKSDEIDPFVEEKLIFNKEDIHDIINDAQSFLSHVCNNR